MNAHVLSPAAVFSPMVVFLPQLNMIDIEIPAHFPSGTARTRTRGGASRMKDAIGKITGGVRWFAAPAHILLDTPAPPLSGDPLLPPPRPSRPPPAPPRPGPRPDPVSCARTAS